VRVRGKGGVRVLEGVWPAFYACLGLGVAAEAAEDLFHFRLDVAEFLL